MSAQDDLVRLMSQVDLLTKMAAAEKTMLAALEAYRADMSEANRVAYRAAVGVFAALREESVADRPGLAITGHAFVSPEQSE